MHTKPSSIHVPTRPHAVVHLAAAAAILFSTQIACSSAQAEGDRPREGTVQFGRGDSSVAGREAPPFSNVFADVASRVIPAVVAVIPTSVDTVGYHRNPFLHFFHERFGDRNPFGGFFGDGDDPQGPEPEVRPRERRQQGMGSGVIVSPQGYILTNYHVVAGADEIEVNLADNRGFRARLIGRDSLSDVAVLKITDKVSDLPVVNLGDSRGLRPGDWVIAIGNPFSLTSSVTVGIVSALGRAVAGQGTFQDFIQTDAAINPGNSGGALVNIRGELIGINTMIYTRSGGYMGIGFAIPITMARSIMEDLIYHGEVIRGWIGVSVQELTEAMREAMRLKVHSGVLVAEVYARQPADRGGLRRGDIVLAIGDAHVTCVNDLRNMIAACRPGESMRIRIMRNGREKTVKVRAMQRSERLMSGMGDNDNSAPGVFARHDGVPTVTAAGITVADITRTARDELGIPAGVRGAVVLDVDPGYGDARRHLRAGDVISEVRANGAVRTVRSADTFREALAKIRGNDALLLLVHRGEHTLFMGFRMRG